MFRHHSIIIDDFYADPDSLREQVLQLPLSTLGGNYAGVVTKEGFFTQQHKEMFKEILAVPEVVPGTSLNGRFRFMKNGDTEKQHIHFDPGQDMAWAGVLFLTLPQHYEHMQTDTNCFGTQFWRHRGTGLKSLPLLASERAKYQWNTVDDLKLFLDTEGMDESLWDLTMQVPMKYNRLVLFRPWMFHSPGRWFGDSFENCRLIQTFFLGVPGLEVA
jgi:hypothetical protein